MDFPCRLLANLGLEVLPKSPHQRANLGKKLGPNPEKMRGKYEEMFEKSSKLEANHHHLTFSTFLAVSGEKSVAIDADLMISHCVPAVSSGFFTGVISFKRLASDC